MYVYRWYSLYSDAFNTGMYLHLVTVRTQRKPFQTSAPALLGHDPIDCVGPALCGVGSVKGKVPSNLGDFMLSQAGTVAQVCLPTVMVSHHLYLTL